MDLLDVSQKLAQELGVNLEAIAAPPEGEEAQELGQDQAAQVSNKWEGMWVMGSPDALQKLAQELG